MNESLDLAGVSHPNPMDLAEMPHMQLEKHKPQACFWVAKLSPC